MPEVTKVTIDQDECISCEACVAECEEALEMVEDKVALKAEAQDPEFLKQHSQGLIAAAEACPCDAIQVETA